MLRSVSSASDAAPGTPSDASPAEPAKRSESRRESGEVPIVEIASPVEPVIPLEDRVRRPTPAIGQASAPRPPVLASEALRRDLTPATPAPRATRRVAVLVGILGAVQSISLAGAQGVAIPLAGAFAALAALGLVPMAYVSRAAALATVAGAGLGVASFAEVAETHRVEPLVLVAGVTTLAAGLLFRAWHRASWLSRALVALGIVVCAGFLTMSQTLQRLPIVDPSWQTWLPQVLQLVLVLLLLLSLLAFMDARSTGGCDAWAVGIVGWYVCFGAVEMLAVRYPATASQLATGPAGTVAALHVAAPLLTGMLALSLAQIWAARAAARTAQ